MKLDENDLEDIEKISKPPMNIDEILNETETADVSTDFEILTDDISFKDELLQEKEFVNPEVQKQEEEKNVLKEKEQENSSTVSEQKGEVIEEIEPDEKLMAKEASGSDFTFNDLLEEIEIDIAIFDEDLSNNNENNKTEKSSMASTELILHKKDKKRGNKQIDNNDIKDNQKQNKQLLMGLKYYRAGKYDKAVEHFNKVIEMYPEFKEAYSILGNAYYHADMVKEAVEIYKTVKKLDPENTDSYENTGVIYANQGKLGKAIKEWKMVVKINPERKDILEHIEEAKQNLKKI